MTFDNEEQRKIILEMLSMPGLMIPAPKLDLMYNFKQTVLAAKIEEKDKEKDESPK